MNHFSRYFAVLAAGACALPAGCGSSDLGDETPIRVAVNAQAPEWSKDIKLVMELKCMNCHARPRPSHAPSDTPALALAEFETFVKQASRVKARVFEDPLDPMPPDYGTPLSSEEKAALKKFVEQTLTENASTGAGTGSGALTLSAAFETHCASCHGDQGEGGAVSKPLPGSRQDAQGFITLVRAGKAGMPKFTSAQIQDADLAKDFDALKTRK
jgi:mono/diheme cytochrome c family protein